MSDEHAHDLAWQALQQWLGYPVDAALRACLAQLGGREVGDEVRFYAVDELLERNQTYEVLSYCPGWLTVGDDGGGRAVMVRPGLLPAEVFLVDHGSMSPDCFEWLGDDLMQWIGQGCPLPQD